MAGLSTLQKLNNLKLGHKKPRVIQGFYELFN